MGRGKAIKLLCVDQCSSAGGAQKSLLDLLGAFSQKGWQPSVAAPVDSQFAADIQKGGYKTHSLNCGDYTSMHKPLSEHLKYAWRMPQLVRSLDRIVEGNQINLIYVNGPRLFPVAAWVGKRAGIPVVFHIHNRLAQPSAIALAGRSIQWTSGEVIACCQHAAAPLRHYVESNRLNVIYNGVRSLKGAERPLPHKLERIGVVGRVEVEKGQLEFVRAARLVSAAFPECRFFVIGQPLFSGFEYYRQVTTSAEGLPVELGSQVPRGAAAACGRCRRSFWGRPAAAAGQAAVQRAKLRQHSRCDTAAGGGPGARSSGPGAAAARQMIDRG